LIHDIYGWRYHGDIDQDVFEQIDKAGDAQYANGKSSPPGYPTYYKSQDTWVYDSLASFLGSVDMAPSSFEAIARLPLGGDSSLGTVTPVSFLQLVLEVQPGLVCGGSANVTFRGELVAFDVPQEQTTSMVFGSQGQEGSFTLTNTPEPATTAMLLVGLGYVVGVLRRRR